MDRFFCPTLTDGKTVTLIEDEFHHLAHVLRGQVGDRVELFDGQGRSAAALVEHLSRREARLSLVEELRTDRPERIALVLGVACPKGDRLKWLVEKATELGVSEFVPLNCERSVVEPRESKLAKLEQTVLAACKQCRRNTIMPIREPQSLSQFLQKDSQAHWIAHPEGERPGDLLRDCLDRHTGDEGVKIAVAIGPEGGFTSGEIDDAQRCGATTVSLGRAILRVETAALAVASIVLAEQ